jgi:hypothetical protein
VSKTNNNTLYSNTNLPYWFYKFHTDAVKDYVVPVSKRPNFEYAEEADLINIALFGCTAQEWRDANPERHKKGENLRDMASINELAVLSNLETHNAEWLKQGHCKQERFAFMQKMAEHQLSVLNGKDFMKTLKKTSKDVYIEPKPKGELS